MKSVKSEEKRTGNQKREERKERMFQLLVYTLVLFFFWSCMFAGPKWFGSTISSFIPFSHSLHYHRFISAIQFFSLLLSGMVIEIMWTSLLCVIEDETKDVTTKDVMEQEVEQAMTTRSEKSTGSSTISSNSNSNSNSNSSNWRRGLISCIFVLFLLPLPGLRERNLNMKLMSKALVRRNQLRSESCSVQDFLAVQRVLLPLPRGRVFVGMPGYRGWCIQMFARLLGQCFFF